MFPSAIESWVHAKACLIASCFSFCVSDSHNLDSLSISITSFAVIYNMIVELFPKSLSRKTYSDNPCTYEKKSGGFRYRCNLLNLYN
jgi:hypothetical protein